jgi:peptidyl-Asp metalloendopeptidase
MRPRDPKFFNVFTAALRAATLLVLLLSIVFTNQKAFSAEKKGLFAPVKVQNIETQDYDQTIIRKRYVKVNFNLLGKLNNPTETVLLNLFENISYTAHFYHSETNYLGSYAWAGDLEDIEYGNATLVITNGILAGGISMPGAHYQLRYVGNDVYAIQEIDQAAFPQEMEPIPVDNYEDKSNRNAKIELASGDCSKITVLVAYSPEARAAAGGTSAIQATISLAVAETNQSYINSGLNQRINLVHTMETSAGEAANSFSIDLNALQNLSDGIFDNVDAARETYYADCVGLIIENASSCGLGYLNANASYAFSVTHRTCATGYYSFGHELGHNMGAHHDWYVEDSGSPGYNKGFVSLPGAWRTVMAYNTLCAVHGAGSCSRLQYWSNPDVNYTSKPMGVISTGPMDCVAGSTSPDPSSCAADNRTRLDNTCSTVSNFRTAPIGTPEINILGNGVLIPDGSTSPSPVNETEFGLVDISGPAVSHTFTIQNIGQANLGLTGTPIVDIIQSLALNYSVTLQPASPTVSSNSSTTFTVSYGPSTVGLSSATVTIANNDADENPYTFDIQGTGSATPVASGSIGHYVYCDANGNGKKDDTEPGLANIVLRLFNKTDPQPVKVPKAKTNADGYYGFVNIPAGEYSVTVDESTLPVGASSSTGGNIHDVTLADNERYAKASFGYRNMSGEYCLVSTIPPATGGNELVFVSGSETFGYPKYSWENAVDKDYDGWDGTTLARGNGDPSSAAFAVFQFADAGTYKFNYVAFLTDNGPDDNGEPYQATSLEVLISTTGTNMSDFASVATIKRKFDGADLEWSSLGDYVKAKYVMLKLHQPAWNRGNWRQIVEFEVHDGATKKGASPAHGSFDVVALPNKTRLFDAYPNPFNPVTTIEFDLEDDRNVSIKAYDLNGRNVATLAKAYYYAGHHRVTWQAESLSSGTYFIVMTAGKLVQTKKAVLLK